MVKISSIGIKIVLTCIKHLYMSYWTTLGSFRHPWGPQNGPKHHPKSPNWSYMTQIDPLMVKISSSGIEIVLTCIMNDYMSYWPTLGSYRHPWGPKMGIENLFSKVFSTTFLLVSKPITRKMQTQ